MEYMIFNNHYWVHPAFILLLQELTKIFCSIFLCCGKKPISERVVPYHSSVPVKQVVVESTKLWLFSRVGLALGNVILLSRANLACT